MHTEGKYRRGSPTPVMVALFVAVAGQALILFNDFGPGSDSRSSGSTTMITATAISRAGAIEIPSEPPAAPPTTQAQ
jgi:hypothetical protein